MLHSQALKGVLDNLKKTKTCVQLQGLLRSLKDLRLNKFRTVVCKVSSFVGNFGRTVFINSKHEINLEIRRHS